MDLDDRGLSPLRRLPGADYARNPDFHPDPDGCGRLSTMRGSCRGATARYGLAALGLAVLLPLALAASPRRLDPVTVLAGSPNYPPGAAEQGVQGTTLLQAALAPDGRFSAPRIHQSSGSARLDEAALALLPRLRSTTGAAEAARQRPRCWCRSLSARTRWQACRHQVLRRFQSRRSLFRIGLSAPCRARHAGVCGSPRRAGRAAGGLARELPGIQQAVVSGCAADPEARFLELLLGAATRP